MYAAHKNIDPKQKQNFRLKDKYLTPQKIKVT
jgi:hypothetical protein